MFKNVLETENYLKNKIKMSNYFRIDQIVVASNEAHNKNFTCWDNLTKARK